MFAQKFYGFNNISMKNVAKVKIKVNALKLERYMDWFVLELKSLNLESYGTKFIEILYCIG